jgi:pimeloyl-ACP methyl ester carboxylesterase
VVAGFIKKLELKNVTIVGRSFGGRVGIKLASAHPELVSKLVLVDSAGFAMEASKKNFYRAVAKIVRPIFKPQAMQGLRKKIYQKIGAEDYLATPELQKTFVNVTSEDLSEDMKKIKVPTLLVYGQNDKDTPPEFGELMKFLIQNSKFKILAGAGHFSFLDRPGEFVEAIKKFIST